MRNASIKSDSSPVIPVAKPLLGEAEAEAS
jgi:hypothetical protein